LLMLSFGNALWSCSLEYPEIVAVNETSDFILLKNISFNGCRWSEVLAKGDATSVESCLPGDDRVHFQKFDASNYCRDQANVGTITGICPCNNGDAGMSSAESGVVGEGLINDLPLWFNYQTQSVKHAGYGEFHRFVISLNDFEQDFSVPGPYGH
jgi:hypothetical protein